MSKNLDGGPAFPAHPEHYDNDTTGMTLRDWFAGQNLLRLKYDLNKSYAETAAEAYRMADAMLEERMK